LWNVCIDRFIGVIIPIPKPKKGEKEQEFISRCMSNSIMNKEYSQEQRSAICYNQWRTKEVNKMIKFNYSVPITEMNEKDSKEFIIEGTAINATTTSNNHKFLEEELQASADTLSSVPLLKDHKNEVDSIMGKVTKSVYGDKKVTFKAKVIDKTAQEMIKDGRLNSVSVGAVVKSFDIDEEDESYVARGITFRELSLVAVGADEGATFGIALSEAYNSTKEQKVELIDDIKENVPEPKVETEKTAPITKEEVSTIVAEAIAKAVEAMAKESKTEEVEKDKETKPEEKEETKVSKEAETEEKEEEQDEVSETYKITQGYGSLKGSSFTVMRG